MFVCIHECIRERKRERWRDNEKKTKRVAKRESEHIRLCVYMFFVYMCVYSVCAHLEDTTFKTTALWTYSVGIV
jgi:hypothetical protein